MASDDWIKKLEDPKMWDQTAFNDLVRLGATHSNRTMKNLWKGDNGKLVVGILPASIYASGHMFFVQVGCVGWLCSLVAQRFTDGLTLLKRDMSHAIQYLPS
jgi:hypothetical protein